MENKKDKNWYPQYRFFMCECDPAKKLSYDGLIQHAKEKHSIDIQGVKFTRQMMVHMNKQPRHSCLYEWSCPELKFYEEVG